MKRWLNWRTASIGTILVMGIAAISHACNVPVFRFALERWRADAYRVTVFHRGPLGDAQRAQLHELEEKQDKSSVNIAVRLVDVTGLDNPSEENAADRMLFALQEGQELPRVVVQYPQHLRIEFPAWSGPLDREAIARLTDSPVRKELARRLAEGQTAVWLLLEAGEREKDDAAASLLEAELKKLEGELKLPELTSDPEDKLLTTGPLKISFSMLRVARGSAAEQSLVGTLIRSEPDLAERNDPMVFPVFGRGRALWALIGAGITAKNIHDSAEFLVGPCSCQVKEQNPGFDLLLSVDWDSLFSEQGVSLTAAQTRLVSPPPSEVELVPIPAGAPPAPVVPVATLPLAPLRSYGFHVPAWWIVGGIGLVVVLLAGGIVGVTQLGRQR